MIVLDNQNPGSRIAQSLGTGLSRGIQALAHNKLQSISEAKQRKSISDTLKLFNPGLTDQQANILASAPEYVQKSVFERGLEGIGAPQGYAQQQAGNIVRAEHNQQYPQQNPAQQQMESDQQPIRLGMTKEQKLAERKQAADQFKFSKELIHDSLQKSKQAKSNLKDLERLEQLESTGKLDTPGYNAFLHNSGLDIPALMNPESEEFQKIATGFIRNAKTLFGSRVTDNEINTFLKTIPTLSQSPEGRKRVIAGMKYINRADLEYTDALKDVLRENKGVPPYDLELQVDDKAGKKLDKVADLFKKDLERPVGKAQNKAITALQSGAGSLLGIPGKVLGKIGNIAGKVLA